MAEKMEFHAFIWTLLRAKAHREYCFESTQSPIESVLAVNIPMQPRYGAG